jgi:hypothetical protein
MRVGTQAVRCDQFAFMYRHCLDISKPDAQRLVFNGKRRMHNQHDSTGQFPSCRLTWHRRRICKPTLSSTISVGRGVS